MEVAVCSRLPVPGVRRTPEQEVLGKETDRPKGGGTSAHRPL